LQSLISKLRNWFEGLWARSWIQGLDLHSYSYFGLSEQSVVISTLEFPRSQFKATKHLDDVNVTSISVSSWQDNPIKTQDWQVVGAIQRLSQVQFGSVGSKHHGLA